MVGLIAGWLAGVVTKGGGYGILADMVLGIPGGVPGGWILSMLGVSTGGGLIGGIIVAFIGAAVVVGITRMVKTARQSIDDTRPRASILKVSRSLP